MNASGFTLTVGEFRDAIAGQSDLDRMEVVFGDDSVTDVTSVEAYTSQVVLNVLALTPVSGLAESMENAAAALASTVTEIERIRVDFVRAAESLEAAVGCAKAAEATKHALDPVNAAAETLASATKNLKSALTASERAAKEVRRVVGKHRPVSAAAA